MGWRLLLAAVISLAASGLVGQTPARMRLQPCQVGAGRGAEPAECGAVTVFENRTSHRGRMIGIHFMVLRAARQPAWEGLFMFAGGSGLGSRTYETAAWPRPVRTTLDIVLVDQRGTG